MPSGADLSVSVGFSAACARASVHVARANHLAARAELGPAYPSTTNAPGGGATGVVDLEGLLARTGFSLHVSSLHRAGPRMLPLMGLTMSYPGLLGPGIFPARAKLSPPPDPPTRACLLKNMRARSKSGRVDRSLLNGEF